MKYKRLGNSGVKISELCLGTMTFGDGADEKMSQKIYGMSREKGINFFDCADVYAKGESERILGRLIKDHRQDVLVASKAYYPTGTDINARGNSRFHLTKALNQSLKNLDTDYIDLYYLHNFDGDTPLQESLETLNDFVRQGKILYIGLSNFAAWQVMKAMSITENFNYAPITCIQPMYNLLKRQCESEILPMARYQKLGVIPYSPVAGGYLTGKYLQKKPDVGRFNTSKMYQNRYQTEQNELFAGMFNQFANENNYHPVSLAIAWVAANADVTAPIIGARNIEQLAPALASVDFGMTKELREKVSEFSFEPALANDRAEERKGGSTKLY